MLMSQKKKTEIKACLIVRGFACDHEEISRIVGILPTEHWRKGDKIGRSRAIHRENGWRLLSGLPNSSDISDHARDILKKVYPRAKKLMLIEELKVIFFVAVYIRNSERPSMFLDQETVVKLGELKAAIDVDLYVLNP
jgi:hypothetical protein